MNLLRATLAVLFALAFAAPSQAAPELATTRTRPVLFATGLHANQVDPIVKGVFVEGAHVAVYTACFLMLASDDTCLDVASKARASLTR